MKDKLEEKRSENFYQTYSWFHAHTLDRHRTMRDRRSLKLSNCSIIQSPKICLAPSRWLTNFHSTDRREPDWVRFLRSSSGSALISFQALATTSLDRDRLSEASKSWFLGDVFLHFPEPGRSGAWDADGRRRSEISQLFSINVTSDIDFVAQCLILPKMINSPPNPPANHWPEGWIRSTSAHRSRTSQLADSRHFFRQKIRSSLPLLTLMRYGGAFWNDD